MKVRDELERLSPESLPKKHRSTLKLPQS